MHKVKMNALIKKSRFPTLSLRIAVFIGLISLTQAKGQERPSVKGVITFQNQSWQQSLELAKKTHKLIFVDAFASWCGPCKDLKAQIFSDAGIGTYFNSHFINVSLDMEKGEGLAFSDKYQVESYPTLLFIDEDGRIISRSEGFVNVPQLNKWAKSIIGNQTHSK